MTPTDPTFITPDDTTYAQSLIDRGFQSISNKYRMVAALRTPLTGKDIVRPELHDTVAGKCVIEQWNRAWHRWVLRDQSPDVERIELTPSQFRAFKQLGGKVA